MQRNIKLAIAMAIIVAGLSAALLFRKEPSATADGGTTPAETLPYRSAANTAAEPTAVTFPGEAATAAPPATGGATRSLSEGAAPSERLGTRSGSRDE